MRRLFSLAAFVVAASFVHAASPLSTESSAFLRSHADSPVDWMPWGEAAFARAKAEQKPVFLAIGSFTSEFSRAMARQTFANVDTAAFLNDAFVCVLVDAKEQPQLTALYQNYIHAVKQLRGLPLNLWLTPELKPFDGANYLPPTEEWGKEGFLTVAKRAAAGWKADPAAQRTKAEEAVSTVAGAQPDSLPDLSDAEIQTIVNESKEFWTARFDVTNSGFNESPKYPEPELLRFLLREPATQEMALTTLRAIIGSALRDPLDGGFFRYAIDAEWKFPYFQKTLADQARIALTLLDAARVSGDATFADAARGALNYTLTLRLPDGDLSAAEDATADTLAASYLWKLSEIRDVLGDGPAKEFAAAHGVTAEGNIPPDTLLGLTTAGENILRSISPASGGDAERKFEASRAKLLAKRQQRPAPRREDHATSGTHGLLLQALTRAGEGMNDAKMLAAARNQLAFIRERLVQKDGTLLRIAGRPHPGVPEDYAFVISGLKEYAAQSKDPDAAKLVASLEEAVNTQFWDEKAGRTFTIGSITEPAYWARVVPPAPLPADLPSADATLLATSTQPSSAGSTKVDVDALRRTVALQARDAEDIARGELLLALAAAKK